MRALTFIGMLLLSSVLFATEPAQHPVTVELGPKSYRDGDVIQITNVTSTSPRLEQGDNVTVRGRALLSSHSKANLCLYLTATESAGHGKSDARQSTVVKRGTNEFELTTTIKNRGALHLTFYHPETGKPLGGVYFGTADQMTSIADWDVRYYLKD